MFSNICGLFEVYIVSLIYCYLGRFLKKYSLIYSHHLDTSQWLVMVVLFLLCVIKVSVCFCTKKN
jgi:Kef-type K+ transport system membrane component KefB